MFKLLLRTQLAIRYTYRHGLPLCTPHINVTREGTAIHSACIVAAARYPILPLFPLQTGTGCICFLCIYVPPYASLEAVLQAGSCGSYPCPICPSLPRFATLLFPIGALFTEGRGAMAAAPSIFSALCHRLFQLTPLLASMQEEWRQAGHQRRENESPPRALGASLLLCQINMTPTVLI